MNTGSERGVGMQHTGTGGVAGGGGGSASAGSALQSMSSGMNAHNNNSDNNLLLADDNNNKGDQKEDESTYFEHFVEKACDAYLILRTHKNELIEFACLAFSYIYDKKLIQDFLNRKLQSKLSDAKARKLRENVLFFFICECL